MQTYITKAVIWVGVIKGVKITNCNCGSVTWPMLECVMQSEWYANTGALLFVPCHLVAGIRLWKSSVFAAVWFTTPFFWDMTSRQWVINLRHSEEPSPRIRPPGLSRRWWHGVLRNARNQWPSDVASCATRTESWSFRLLVSNVRLARCSRIQFAACDSVRMKLSVQYRDSVVFVVFGSTDMGRSVL